jgi:hypothetical protein
MDTRKGNVKSLTTQDFIRTLFGPHRKAYVTSREPGATGGWVGWNCSIPGEKTPQNDQYFLVCTVLDEKLGHKRENLDEAVCFYLDDVKKHMATVIQEKLGPPSYVVETSKDNFSWYYKLTDGERRLDLFEACVSAAKALGFTDTGGTLASKWMRLPGGSNNKHVPPWRVRGWRYVGVASYELDVLAGRLGVDVADPSSWAGVSGAMLPDGVPEKLRTKDQDGIWQRLDAGGYVKGARPGSKWLDVICPWRDEHTSPETASGTGYLPSLDGGVFKCLHEHCAGRGVRELEAWLDGIAPYYRHPKEGAGDEFEVVEENPSDLVNMLVDSYAYMKVSRRYLDRVTRSLLAPETVNDLWRHRFPSGKGNVAPDRRWHAECDPLMDIVEDTTYQYGGPRILSHGAKRLYNTWDEFRVDAGEVAPPVTDGEVAPWLDLCARVIPDQGMRELWFDWCGYLVGGVDKPNWQWIFTSLHQGIGKDTMLEPLKACLGQGNYVVLQADAIAGRFNDWLENRLIVVNEMKSEARQARNIYNICKTYWAAPPQWLSVDKKNRPLYEVWNGTGWVLTSNHLAPVALELGDRRISMVQSEAGPLSSTEAALIWDWLDGGGRLLAARWIWARGAGLSLDQRRRFKDRAPDSQAKLDAARASMSNEQAWLAEQIDGKDWPDVWDVGSIMDEIQKQIIGHGLPGPAPTHQMLGRWIKELGGIGLGQIRVNAYDRKNVVALRNVEKYKNLNSSKIREVYNKAPEFDVVDDLF